MGRTATRKTKAGMPARFREEETDASAEILKSSKNAEAASVVKNKKKNDSSVKNKSKQKQKTSPRKKAVREKSKGKET